MTQPNALKSEYVNEKCSHLNEFAFVAIKFI